MSCLLADNAEQYYRADRVRLGPRVEVGGDSQSHTEQDVDLVTAAVVGHQLTVRPAVSTDTLTAA